VRLPRCGWVTLDHPGPDHEERVIALAVCLLLDRPADLAVRALWRRLEAAGVPTLLSHTHGQHVPHVTYAALRSGDPEAVSSALAALPEAAPMTLRFDAFGTFRRSRCWLGPAVSADLVARQQQVASAAVRVGAELHHHYRPDEWVPHLTLAPRLHLTDLPTVAAAVYDVLPLTVRVSRAALIDTSSGRRQELPHLV
jgi:2'-5' RNA ligase